MKVGTDCFLPFRRNRSDFDLLFLDRPPVQPVREPRLNLLAVGLIVSQSGMSDGRQARCGE
jgi:hypothetical protein